MSDYRILKNLYGYHIQKDCGKYILSCEYCEYEDDWQTILTVKTLAKAKKEKEKLELIEGIVYE